MISRGRLSVFSLTGLVGYTLAYYFDWPLFRYYLASGQISIMPQPDSAGPPILLYGWVLTAVLAGLVVCLLVPRALAARIPPDLLWLVPVAATAAAVLYELRWFA
jgi:hypothetical protein